MHRRVTLTFLLDPEEYHKAQDTPRGTINVARDIINGDADWPDRQDQKSGITIKCENAELIIPNP